MSGRIVEIVNDRRHLAAEKGFLTINEGNREVARIPFDTIDTLVLNAYGLTYTNSLLVRLADAKVPAVVCGNNHLPKAYLLPIDGHYKQGAIMDAQAAASVPLKKRLWQQIIKNKISQQASLLSFIDENPLRLLQLVPKVKSGDQDNCEGQAARIYWPLLFGSQFRRDRDEPGINGLLNYGYTILRSAIVRAIVCAGLHPTMGLFHKNILNPMRLGDDLMEVFRPFVDMTVYVIVKNGISELSNNEKKHFVELMSVNLPASRGDTELGYCIQSLAISLAQIYLSERKYLDLPKIMQKRDWINLEHVKRL
jgi:CRISPR-associated protein Cas1